MLFLQIHRFLKNRMGHDFAGSMEDMSHTYDGMLSTIEDYEAQIQNAMGNAYNEERKNGEGGLQYQIDWYEKNADEMAEMYAELGKWTAEQDNAADKLLFDTYSEILDSDLRSMDKSDLYAQMLSAKTEAEAKYMKTEEHDQLLTAQNALIERLKTELEPVYYEWGYKLMIAFSKGLGSVGVTQYTQERTEASLQTEDSEGRPVPAPGFAFGFSYVPYDDYPAMLHQGERVLTAAQNREYSSYNGGITINIEGLTVREEADIDRIADELHFRIRAAAANYSEVV